MSAATCFLILLWISGISSTEWCRTKGVPAPFVDSFVKMTGMTPATLSPQHRLLMYESPGNVVTAECHNRCRDSSNCPAFIVDYVRGACYFVAKESETSWGRINAAEVVDAPTVGFFERACFRIPPECGPRAWVIERVPGYILAGLPDMENTPRKTTRENCAQFCLDFSNSTPPCRSARYNASSSECVLSTEDRRSQPDAFRASSWDVEYMENQCAPLAPQTATCSYQQLDNVTLLQADLQIVGLSPDDCKARCGSEQSFRCRAYSVRPPEPGQGAAYICVLHAGDTLSDGPSQLRPRPGAIYSERLACLDLRVSCNQYIMEISLATPTPFSGRIYVNGGSNQGQCGVDGQGQTTTRLLLPLGRDVSAAAAAGMDMRCGLRLARAIGQSLNRTLVSAIVVVQKNPIIQTRGDRAVRVGCVVDSGGHSVGNDVALGSSVMVSEPEVSGDEVTDTGKISPIVRLSILDESGVDAGGVGSLKEVQLGQPLTLKIEVAKGDQPVGILATHLVASSSDGRDSYLLLDSRGCPADPATFPELRPLPTGEKEPGGPYVLVSSFRAFRFPASPVVRFSLRVHFCPGGCPPVDCGNNIASHGRRRRSTDEKDTKNERMPNLEFPLQLAIVVHTPRVVAAPRREISVGNSTILMLDPSAEAPELACVSSGALWGLAAAALVLQAAILLVCCYTGRRAVLSGLKCRRCGHDSYRCKGVCNGVASTKLSAYDNPTMLDRRVTWADE